MLITPGVGVGAVRFGQTREEVAALLGQPERVENETLDSERSIAWHYPSLSLYFDEDAEFRLVMFDVDHPDTELDGFKPIGLDEENVLEVIEGMGEVVLEDELDDLDRRVFDLVDSGVWFWFHRGRCDSVQVSILLDENDGYCWPD